MNERISASVGESQNRALDRHSLLQRFHADVQALLERRTNDTAPVVSDSKPFSFPASSETNQAMNIDERARYLRSNSDRMPIYDFVHEGLIVGAQRMDARRVMNGLEPIHVSTLEGVLKDDKTRRAFTTGNTALLDFDRPGLKPVVKRTAKLVADHLDPNFNNPVMIYEVTGLNYHTRDATGRGFINPDLEKLMRNKNWSPKLQALMTAVGMHHRIAMKDARRLVTPLLAEDATQISDVKEGFEKRLWERRVSGLPGLEGAFFYLGYTEKSRALLQHHMEEMWGDDYSHNRQVFLATAFMRTGHLSDAEKKKVHKLRDQVYTSIGEGNFQAAKEHLQTIACDRRTFHRISLSFLLDEHHSRSKSDQDVEF